MRGQPPIYSRAARAREARQFYGQLGDASGLIDHRAAGLDLAPSSHTPNRPHNTHNHSQTGYTRTHTHQGNMMLSRSLMRIFTRFLQFTQRIII